MPPSSAEQLRSLRESDRLSVGGGGILDARPLATRGLSVLWSDGSRRDVGRVLNCTGPRLDLSLLRTPLIDDVLQLRSGRALATLATAGMGLRTQEGRLVHSAGSTEAPLWTLGALRRGELWESTALPEIRVQARAQATAVLRRRPRSWPCTPR